MLAALSRSLQAHTFNDPCRRLTGPDGAWAEWASALVQFSERVIGSLVRSASTCRVSVPGMAEVGPGWRRWSPVVLFAKLTITPGPGRGGSDKASEPRHQAHYAPLFIVRERWGAS